MHQCLATCNSKPLRFACVCCWVMCRVFCLCICLISGEAFDKRERYWSTTTNMIQNILLVPGTGTIQVWSTRSIQPAQVLLYVLIKVEWKRYCSMVLYLRSECHSTQHCAELQIVLYYSSASTMKVQRTGYWVTYSTGRVVARDIPLLVQPYSASTSFRHVVKLWFWSRSKCVWFAWFENA